MAAASSRDCVLVDSVAVKLPRAVTTNNASGGANSVLSVLPFKPTTVNTPAPSEDELLCGRHHPPPKKKVDALMIRPTRNVRAAPFAQVEYAGDATARAAQTDQQNPFFNPSLLILKQLFRDLARYRRGTPDLFRSPQIGQERPQLRCNFFDRERWQCRGQAWYLHRAPSHSIRQYSF